jgi:hypothetical protein
MEAMNNGLQEKKPLMAFFLQPFPSSIYQNNEDTVYNPVLQINESIQGIPYYTMARSATPPTSCTTPGHTVKSGYTSTGKYKPSKYMPSKTDKRAGK